MWAWNENEQCVCVYVCGFFLLFAGEKKDEEQRKATDTDQLLNRNPTGRKNNKFPMDSNGARPFAKYRLYK